MVVNDDVVREVSAEHLSPSALLVVLLGGFVGHGGVANHEDGDGAALLGAGEGHEGQNGGGQGVEKSFHR